MFGFRRRANTQNSVSGLAFEQLSESDDVVNRAGAEVRIVRLVSEFIQADHVRFVCLSLTRVRELAFNQADPVPRLKSLWFRSRLNSVVLR